ncbi:hypothetical protein PpBr36_08460 [Pyricularia pennisetigena]|uniref:hypothetical protein n=1 Tax=Pyricularia pennisetigena TaxID=1578925 RepID=UPI001152DB49|nr:hypothetical protein PpBr36_08460 [Pyricularia pennisetigena]TLS24224.1 hypothetical protein PpBr36_08460 [Pyricularia pennisetigena]
MADAAERQITRGAIAAIFNDPEGVKTRFPVPVLQCLQVKLLGQQPNAGAAERYRVVLSDIDNYIQCMLATQANHVIHDDQLQRGCIVRVKSYQANTVKGKSVLVLLDLEVIQSLGVHEKIGEPTSIEAKAENTTNTTIGGSGFYGTKTEPDVKPQIRSQMPTRNAGGGGASHGPGNVNIYPIESISPYQHKWTIKARVSQKSDIRTWHKASGEGKLFSVNLLDETGEIKATAFNDQCDKFYDILQEGQVYYISTPCRVGIAKKQFTNLPNDYEITFEDGTQIEKAEDQSSVPQVRFNFCNIQELQEVEKDATVDVVGVLKDVGEVSQITSKSSGKFFDKRELTLVDDSGYSVRMTIWGKTAQNFDAKPESVVAFKGAKVGDFGGRSLSLLSSGTMTVDPDIPEAHRLKGWFDSSGRNDNFSTFNSSSVAGATGRQDQILTIHRVKEDNLGMDDVAYFALKATVVYIRQENFAYPSCLNEGCSKKVTDLGDGSWRCEKCDVNHPRPEYRYIMSVNVTDHTGQLWLSCFDDVGRIIMGKSADELMALKDENFEAFTREFENANCRKLSFRCRAKMDTFGDNQRVRYQVMGATKMDWKSEAARLAELIKQFNI